MTFYDENGKELYSSGPESNQMLRSFVSNTATRPSCYECKFKKVNRVSDFTAWDCYNVYKYEKQLDDNKGTSHLMIHNKKAEGMLEELSKYLSLKPVDKDAAIASEPAMLESATASDMREDFFDSLSKGHDVFDEFFLDTFKVKLEKALRVILSKTGLYSFIKRKIKG